ncbi:HTR-like protein [Halobacteriales archaeon QS_1_68_17]|nr:MAG: HTR-like protein [Halobacteriales archaeon QS_1_68_17]
MDRIPFGIQRLDTIINGGAPPGSVVLLAGEPGAGAREFMHTSAAINGLARGDSELHDLYYGDLAAGASLPDEIHYLSFTSDSDRLYGEINQTLDDEIVAAGLEAVTFHDLSIPYFHHSRVPRDWYADEVTDIREMRASHDREGLLSRLGDLLSAHAADNLVLIDSLTDLVSTVGNEFEWSDINYFVQGLQKAAHSWSGLVLVEVNSDALTPQEYGQLVDAVSGTMEFSWEAGGSERARTLVVKQFRGVLSRIEDEDIVQFETDIGDAGFDISDVRKIR